MAPYLLDTEQELQVFQQESQPLLILPDALPAEVWSPKVLNLLVNL